MKRTKKIEENSKKTSTSNTYRASETKGENKRRTKQNTFRQFFLLIFKRNERKTNIFKFVLYVSEQKKYTHIQYVPKNWALSGYNLAKSQKLMDMKIDSQSLGYTKPKMLLVIR